MRCSRGTAFGFGDCTATKERSNAVPRSIGILDLVGDFVECSASPRDACEADCASFMIGRYLIGAMLRRFFKFLSSMEPPEIEPTCPAASQPFSNRPDDRHATLGPFGGRQLPPPGSLRLLSQRQGQLPAGVRLAPNAHARIANSTPAVPSPFEPACLRYARRQRSSPPPRAGLPLPSGRPQLDRSETSVPCSRH
jgi:hypothetical protein